MIWIVLTITFYFTSGIFFACFNKELHIRFGGVVWDFIDMLVWTILWLPIALIILILATYTEIREWLHG